MASKRKPQPGDIYARNFQHCINIVLIDVNGEKVFLKGSSSGILNIDNIKKSSMKMGTSDYILIGTLQDLEDTIIKEVFKDE